MNISYELDDCQNIGLFDDKVLLPFEDAEFYAPKDWDKVLRNIFGDYMQLPPKEEQVPHTSYAKFFWK